MTPENPPLATPAQDEVRALIEAVEYIERYGLMRRDKRKAARDAVDLLSTPPPAAASEPVAAALREVAACMLNGADGQPGDYGWNISRLTKARPMIRDALAAISPAPVKGDPQP